MSVNWCFTEPDLFVEQRKALSEEARTNLNRLADHLLSLPEDYKHFDMGVYFGHRDEHGWIEVSTEEVSEYPIESCGTVACAAGHIVVLMPEALERFGTWHDLVDGVLFGGQTLSGLWEFLFSILWRQVDNTPAGAGKRIKMLLEGIEDELRAVSEMTIDETVKTYNCWWNNKHG